MQFDLTAEQKRSVRRDTCETYKHVRANYSYFRRESPRTISCQACESAPLFRSDYKVSNANVLVRLSSWCRLSPSISVYIASAMSIRLLFLFFLPLPNRCRNLRFAPTNCCRLHPVSGLTAKNHQILGYFPNICSESIASTVRLQP